VLGRFYEVVDTRVPVLLTPLEFIGRIVSGNHDYPPRRLRREVGPLRTFEASAGDPDESSPTGYGRPKLGTRPRRRRRRLEQLADDFEHLLARTVLDREEASEIEYRQLDPADRAHGAEAEVGEEVAREDGPVDEEALGRGRPFPVAIGEGLERAGVLVPDFPDRGQERLLDPRLRVGKEADAGDKDGVVGGPSSREVGGASATRRGSGGPTERCGAMHR